MKNKLILFLSILFLSSGIFIVNFSNYSSNLNEMRIEIHTVLSNLENGLSTKDGVLLIDKDILNERNYLIGNRNVLVLIDDTKELDNNISYKNYLIDERVKYKDSEFIIYFTKDRVISHTSLGWGNYKYSDLENNNGTNYLTGSNLLKDSKINFYIFENVPLLILNVTNVFISSLIQIFLLLVVFNYYIYLNKIFNTNSYKQLY